MLAKFSVNQRDYELLIIICIFRLVFLAFQVIKPSNLFWQAYHNHNGAVLLSELFSTLDLEFYVDLLYVYVLAPFSI